VLPGGDDAVILMPVPSPRLQLPLLFRLLLAAVTAACAGHTPPARTSVTQATASDEIAAARARSNAAIAAHDTAAIVREWMPDIHVVASTGAQTAGAAANAQAMQAQFTKRPDTKWVRASKRITVFDLWEVASEEGEWVGTWTDPDGPVRVRGTYLAQWRHVDGLWRIQAEVFVPLSCEGGAYCARHP
jgi:ketosteroid isomerase-like protein